MTTALADLDLEEIGRALVAVEDMPHKAFVPNGAQRKMIDAVARFEKRVYLMLAANGIGKTKFAVALLANIIWLGENPYFKHPLFLNWRHPVTGRALPKRIRIISTPNNIKGDTDSSGGSIQTAINELFPRNRYKGEKGKQGYRHIIRSDTGWFIQILSSELPSDQFAGPEFSLIWYDEPFPRTIRQENKARLRQGGFELITMTPVADPGTEASYLLWIKEELVDGDLECHTEQFDYKENTIEHGCPGFIPEEDMLRAVEGCPDSERAARLNGEFNFAGGMVHENWGKFRESIRMDPYPFEDWKKDKHGTPTIYHFLDPHDAKPFVMVWLAIFPDGHGEFIAEYPDTYWYHQAKSCTLTFKDYVKVIDDIEAQFGVPVYCRVIDKYFGNKTVLRDNMRSSIKMELYYNSGKRFIFHDSPGGHDSWKEARVLIGQKLKPNELTKLPEWRAWNTLNNLDYAMMRHVLVARSGLAQARHGDFGQPSDKHKCFPNCVEYAALFDPKWWPRRVERAPEPWYAPAGNDYARMAGVA